MAYSIWAEPPAGAFKDKLQHEIQRLANIHKGPSFTPHVTLVGGIWLTSQQEIIARATAAAKRLKRFTIRLAEPSAGSTYHQCVYLLCEKDEALVATAQALREATDVKLEADYLPHLSLLYASMSKESREAVVAEVTANFQEGSATALPTPEFSVHSITVWHTPLGDSSCREWSRVADIPLQT